MVGTLHTGDEGIADSLVMERQLGSARHSEGKRMAALDAVGDEVVLDGGESRAVDSIAPLPVDHVCKGILKVEVALVVAYLPLGF